MYSTITNMSVTASHLRMILIGAFDISFRVSTMTLKMLARVPKRQICGCEINWPRLCPDRKLMGCGNKFPSQPDVAYHKRNISVYSFVLQ